MSHASFKGATEGFTSLGGGIENTDIGSSVFREIST